MNTLIGVLRQFGEVFQWWVTVHPWEAGIRVRCGKRVQLLSGGMHLRIPFIDHVYVHQRYGMYGAPLDTGGSNQ